ncbi:hypothetical protein CRUP_000558 [Coryphaenoides rupestris]|nr:hypothetical protein CRUP_000558 [Coryphaenoides rupestris]
MKTLRMLKGRMWKTDAREDSTSNHSVAHDTLLTLRLQEAAGFLCSSFSCDGDLNDSWVLQPSSDPAAGIGKDVLIAPSACQDTDMEPTPASGQKVDTAAQIPWYERLSEFKLPWEMNGEKQTAIRCGKTSLLDIITCRDEGGQVRQGQVLINGTPCTPQLVRRNVAHVRQDDRLLPHLTVRETLAFVDDVIAELRLRQCAHTRVGNSFVRGVSGGERRRVSIAVQLLWNPGILILDEPTSGLDSFTAHNLVLTLSRLARGNRLVLLSVHQPRSDIFQLFDLVVLLSSGSAVYCGAARDMEELCLERARTLAQKFQEKIQDSEDFMWSSSEEASSRRHMYNDFRDLVTLLVHGLEALLMSLLVGCLYYGAGPERLSVQDTVALLYMIGALTPFAVVLDVIAKCHTERAMLYHELEDGLYSVTSYFFAKVLGELPSTVSSRWVYGLPMLLAGRPDTPCRCRFLLSPAAVWLMPLHGTVVAAVLPTLQTSPSWATPLFTVFYLTGALSINLENMWLGERACLRGLRGSDVSFMRWGFQGMLLVQFEGNMYPVSLGNFT